MYTTQEGSTSPLPMSDEDREKIREQLNRLLETHHFNHSRRYPPLLRFIVEETLAGRGEYLKERLIGIRVFDRPADYDTAADPVVRVTIAEIRKRIAQYYHDEEHDAEIRIELLPGRYAPEFRTRSQQRAGATVPPSAAEVAELRAMGVPQPAPVEEVTSVPSRPTRVQKFVLLAAVLLVASLLFAPALRWIHPAAIEDLWATILASPRFILFCLPTDVGIKRGPAGAPPVDDAATGPRRLKSSAPGGPTFLDYESLGENVVYSDMLAALRIANVLAVHHHEYRTKLNVSTTLEDLRQGPSILIGGLDNQWTMRALAPLRYHFAGSDEDRYWIADARVPNFKDWSLDLKQHYGAVTRDYAIIARLHNEETGQPQVVVAGIGMSGTAAAGEFIGDPVRVEELRQRVGKGFKDHDFEVVLTTDVVNGIAGSPKILAVEVW